MDRNPAVTVLTAVYNGERYIKEAIDSILAQTYGDFEYIIVDNNSTDGTPETLEDYARRDERIKVIKEMKPGAGNARNTGLKIAKGDWIAILDADDVALPNRIELQLNYIKGKPHVYLLGSDCIVIDENGGLIKRYRYPADHSALINNLEDMRSIFPHSSYLIKRQPVVNLNGYRERFPTSEDTDLCLRLSSYGLVVCINKPLVKVRKHAGGISNPMMGEMLPLLTIAALVCHLRRRVNLSDPSVMKEKTWCDFLKWLETHLENMGIFKRMDDINLLRKIWYSRTDSFIYRLPLMFNQILFNRSAREALLRGSFPRDLTTQLAEESRSVFV